MAELAEKMNQFYSTSSGRNNYQELLDHENNKEAILGGIAADLIDYLINQSVDEKKILEVGCGRGNIYQSLHVKSPGINYYGVEVAPYIIELNQMEFKSANWNVGTAYDLPFQDETFDICYSHFVLEHLIYVEAALIEMMRVLKPGGKLILIFPDFVELKFMPSQYAGLSLLPTALDRLKRKRFLDALISLYDSRVRIPKYLKQIRDFGPFPINVNPVCLLGPEKVHPDIDALYIASKNEIESWAQDKGYVVEYPYGKSGLYKVQAFMVLLKSLKGNS